MDNLIKILAILNKPYHYLTVGLFLFLWKYFLDLSLGLYFWSGIFISLALACVIEKITKIVAHKYANYTAQKKEIKTKEKKKQYYISEYKKLNDKEKEIIDTCLKNNVLVYCSSAYEIHRNTPIMYSLVEKKLGNNITCGGDFMMDKSCYDVLQEYRHKKDKQND